MDVFPGSFIVTIDDRAMPALELPIVPAIRVQQPGESRPTNVVAFDRSIIDAQADLERHASRIVRDAPPPVLLERYRNAVTELLLTSAVAPNHTRDLKMRVAEKLGAEGENQRHLYSIALREGLKTGGVGIGAALASLTESYVFIRNLPARSEPLDMTRRMNLGNSGAAALIAMYGTYVHVKATGALLARSLSYYYASQRLSRAASILQRSATS